jgi:hypothetical protein
MPVLAPGLAAAGRLVEVDGFDSMTTATDVREDGSRFERETLEALDLPEEDRFRDNLMPPQVIWQPTLHPRPRPGLRLFLRHYAETGRDGLLCHPADKSTARLPSFAGS